MKKKAKRRDDTYLIEFGSGSHVYDISGIDTKYVVEGRFEKPTYTDKDNTFADVMEDILSNEFIDLTAEVEKSKMKDKPVRSTAGRER